jgi:hypothetical protein
MMDEVKFKMNEKVDHGEMVCASVFKTFFIWMKYYKNFLRTFSHMDKL